MKFTPEVLAALATLRANAENDFERHRIDVLERDLTAPPTVEVIDDTHQKFDGVIYKSDINGHFIKNRFQLHRAVWSYCYGEIPDGYHIHHIDENKSNNNISNLQPLSPSEHSNLHHIIAEKKECVCEFCGKKFLSSAAVPPRCCSSTCYYHWHKENKKEIRECPICGKTFLTFKSSRGKCCSPQCTNKAHAETIRKPVIKRLCAICGKEFTVPPQNPNKKCCSKSCGRRLGLITQKNRQATLLHTPLKIDVVASKPTESSITDE